jgi:hypothetical protein
MLNDEIEDADRARRLLRHQAADYCRRIKNPAKREYAKRYADFLLRGDGDESPEHACSSMAAQAVRLNIYDMFKSRGL